MTFYRMEFTEPLSAALDAAAVVNGILEDLGDPLRSATLLMSTVEVYAAISIGHACMLLLSRAAWRLLRDRERRALELWWLLPAGTPPNQSEAPTVEDPCLDGFTFVCCVRPDRRKLLQGPDADGTGLPIGLPHLAVRTLEGTGAW